MLCFKFARLCTTMVLLTGVALVGAATADEACEALAVRDFSTLPDAPTQAGPCHCRVGDGWPGYCKSPGLRIAQVAFELRIPIQDWNSTPAVHRLRRVCAAWHRLLAARNHGPRLRLCHH